MRRGPSWHPTALVDPDDYPNADRGPAERARDIREQGRIAARARALGCSPALVVHIERLEARIAALEEA